MTEIRTWRGRRFLCAAALCASVGLIPATAQQPPRPKPTTPVERIDEDRLRIGTIRIDMARREISAPGAVTDATTLEFVAVTKGGFKAYESALEIDTDAISFNLALILIGLDPSRAVVPKFHIDPEPPKGDPVEIWVEWNENGKSRRVRAEELIYNQTTSQTLSEGPWVYTGSVFNTEHNAYLADVEGSLIGFVHTPAPVIENPRPLVPGTYGANRLNPRLNLKPGTKIQLSVRALPRE